MLPDLNPMTFVAFAAVLLAWIAMMGAGIYLVARLITKNAGGGWSRLLPHYATSEVPPDVDRLARGRTVQVGHVIAKRCATVGVGPRGFYLKAPWRQAALIPWTEIRSVTPTTLYGRPAMSLAVGESDVAKLTVFLDEFEAMRPYLRRDHAGGARSVAAETAATS